MKCEKLIYRSPMFGSVRCEALENYDDNSVDIEPAGMWNLYNRGIFVDTFLNNYEEDLVEHVPEELKDIVVKAVFGKYEEDACEMYFITEIYVKQEPTDLQYDQIKSWISGQMSDGWGEGLEQESVHEERVYRKTIEFDANECEFTEDEDWVYADYYIHPWRHFEFTLDLIRRETVELDIPEEDKTAELKMLLDEISQKLKSICAEIDNTL